MTYDDNLDVLYDGFSIQCAACSKFPVDVEEWLKSKSLPYIIRSAFDSTPFPNDPDLIVLALDNNHPEEIYFRNPRHNAMFVADGFGE